MQKKGLPKIGETSFVSQSSIQLASILLRSSSGSGKADQEQAQFIRTFLLRPTQEILDNAWEYVVRQDIIEALQDFDLDNEQAETLLQLPDTMDVLAQAVLDQNTRHMDMVVDIIEEKADELRSEQTGRQ